MWLGSYAGRGVALSGYGRERMACSCGSNGIIHMLEKTP
jgi:hypothetical protein